jgi:hypothetical protein
MSAPAAPPSPVTPTLLGRLWRGLKGAVVFCIVVFHLVTMAIRNPLDLWYEEVKEWLKEEGLWERHGERFRRVDRFTWKYLNGVGCEQRFSMFSPPVARGAPFLAFRYEFTDGSSELVPSAQEPDPTSFFRLGGWQRRKLEGYLVYPPDDLHQDGERVLWEGQARQAMRQWRADHPDDPRRLKGVTFIRRRIHFPHFDDDPTQYAPPGETVVARFDAEGRLLP